MGFRSTYISEDHAIDYPQWFRDKYAVSTGGVIYSVCETKYPNEVAQDCWKALKEIEWFEKDTDIDFNIVVLHECGGVTKVQMGRDYMTIGYPSDWTIDQHLTEEHEYARAQAGHMYCYGCSDLRRYVTDDSSH
jgi:hypothetical protein